MPPFCSVPATFSAGCMPPLAFFSMPATLPAGHMPSLRSVLSQSHHLNSIGSQRDSHTTTHALTRPPNPATRRSPSPRRGVQPLPTAACVTLVKPSTPIVHRVFNRAPAEMRFPPAPYAWGAFLTESSSAIHPLPGTASTRPLPSVSEANYSSARTTNPSAPIGSTNEVAPANDTTNVTSAPDAV